MESRYVAILVVIVYSYVALKKMYKKKKREGKKGQE